jgi:hypothetical protein
VWQILAIEPSPPGLAIASASILTALLDMLVQRGVLTATEVQQILVNARSDVDEFKDHEDYKDALLLLEALFIKFEARAHTSAAGPH